MLELQEGKLKIAISVEKTTPFWKSLFITSSFILLIQQEGKKTAAKPVVGHVSYLSAAHYPSRPHDAFSNRSLPIVLQWQDC